MYISSGIFSLEVILRSAQIQGICQHEVAFAQFIYCIPIRFLYCKREYLAGYLFAFYFDRRPCTAPYKCQDNPTLQF